MTCTIFTPTYNRGYIIHKLYESLCSQTDKDFEWLIVDDGSTDNTKELVSGFVQSADFPVRYYYKENQGKSSAVNVGAQKASGELFFIVDSDDALVPNALEIIKEEYRHIEDNELFCGVCGIKCYFDGTKVGGGEDFGVLECSSIDFRYKYDMKGDMSEVIKTDIIRQYPYPVIDGEKYMAPAGMWLRVAEKYKFRYFYKGVYLCDYLPDGLSRQNLKLRRKCPIGAMYCAMLLNNANVSMKIKAKSAINYWRFAFCTRDRRYRLSGFYRLFAPIGYVLNLYDSWKLR